jgi:hypothetical protein
MWRAPPRHGRLVRITRISEAYPQLDLQQASPPEAITARRKNLHVYSLAIELICRIGSIVKPFVPTGYL